MTQKTTQVEANPFSVLGDALESAAETFEEATANAQTSAKKAAVTAKRALSNGVHKTAYTAAYGVVFASVFLLELWPDGNPWRVGLEEGTAAALEERRKIREAKLRAQAAKAAEAKVAQYAHDIQARADQFEAAAALDQTEAVAAEA